MYIISQIEFVQQFGDGLTGNDTDILRRAYVIGEALHRGQLRDEGTPYFNHPISVTRTLFNEIGHKSLTGICGALLHDVVEDSEITSDDLRAIFNDEIANTVRLLTKISGVTTADYMKAIEEESPETALPIKLCDRLDNLRGLHLSKKPDKRARYLRETENYFLPLAERHNNYVYEQYKLLIGKLS